MFAAFLDSGVTLEVPPGVDPGTVEGYAALRRAVKAAFIERLQQEEDGLIIDIEDDETGETVTNPE